MRVTTPKSSDSTTDRVLLTIEQLWTDSGQPPTLRTLATRMSCSNALISLALTKLRADGRLAVAPDGAIGRVTRPRTWPEWRVLARYYRATGPVETLDQPVAAPSLLWALRWAVPDGAVIIQIAGEHTFITQARNSSAAAAHH